MYVRRNPCVVCVCASVCPVGSEVAHLMVDLATKVAHLGVPLPLTSGGCNRTGTSRHATSDILRQLWKWPRVKATTALKGSHRAKLSCHESRRCWDDALRHAAKTLNMGIICSSGRQYICRCCHSRTMNVQIPWERQSARSTN